MSELRYQDVFVAGGYPQYTYNPRHTLALEQSIESSLNNLCKLVVVTGHTKSGKTVLVRKVIPYDNAVWLDGGVAGDEDDFWSIIVDQLQLYQTEEVEASTTASEGLTGEASLEGNIFVAKAGGKLAGTKTDTQQNGVRQSRTISSKAAALSGLRRLKIPLVIDDFHYLPKVIQGNVIRALKPLIFDGIPVIIIAIPHRRYDAVKVEKEMTGRILSVNVPIWSDEELSFIPMQGFPLLGATPEAATIEQVVREAIGSPHLMQEFCKEICRSELLAHLSKGTLGTQALEGVFTGTAENTIGRPIFEKLARGPRQRQDRKERTLKTGVKVDIYGLVLVALAHIRPDLVTLEYEGLRAAIREVCEPEDVPALHEVALVLKHMAEISATDDSSTPVIDFDEEDKQLHITDPFFAFYLRWGDIVREA